jgi:hypothetical protein
MVLEISDLTGCVLVKDALASDASFIFVHALRLLLAGEPGYDAIVVLSRNTAAYLAAVLKRLGVTMLSLVDQGRLVVIDTLRQFAPVVDADGTNSTRYLDANDLLLKIVAGSRTLRGRGHPACIVFEDLTVRGPLE